MDLNALIVENETLKRQRDVLYQDRLMQLIGGRNFDGSDEDVRLVMAEIAQEGSNNSLLPRASSNHTFTEDTMSFCEDRVSTSIESYRTDAALSDQPHPKPVRAGYGLSKTPMWNQISNFGLKMEPGGVEEDIMPSSSAEILQPNQILQARKRKRPKVRNAKQAPISDEEWYQFATRLKQLRKSSNLTQKQLGKSVGVCEVYIVALESPVRKSSWKTDFHRSAENWISTMKKWCDEQEGRNLNNRSAQEEGELFY